MRTQVAIVGAGPAGLLLSHLLWMEGIDSIVLENRSRDYVEKRVRAGVCEDPTVKLLREVGLAERLDVEGMPHRGIVLRFDGEDHRIALTDLTGRTITVYGQQEIVKDLIAARLKADAQIHFEVSDVELHDVTGDKPRVTYMDSDGVAHEIQADVIAGCDGFHGISRPSVPDSDLTVYDHVYPFAWLGVLVEAPPANDELIYANHENGFALHSMRTPEVTRLYLQVDPADSLDRWSDARIWDELQTRFAIDGFALHEGPILERLLSPMRSFVVEPMRYGRLFLAGDSAHIVPPTGAKGMNLAVHDVLVLSRALKALLSEGNSDLVDSYSDTCLRRVWRAEQFSYFMTTMLHRDNHADAFQHRLRLAQLRYTASSSAAATSLAENYVGLPFP
ncbi:4-hydroxybenzoate 3-monooxygenase [Kibdelosporangium philippinense]|uniref:4-hydroxybenzoate 3-monooxygenase n=1 Tax=Kibdelosporangium philippinense TaxID=211113 RepID=A0ABS8Z6B3_9PSEU|nr:4-hydroxybenzoate 3-monooxygenase [Kibdelosporangium philippinense]MCE7001407.1 4-hydroxybenzoate 3-monooxygenase [Kibdelosporangium philippinense]